MTRDTFDIGDDLGENFPTIPEPADHSRWVRSLAAYLAGVGVGVLLLIAIARAVGS